MEVLGSRGRESRVHGLEFRISGSRVAGIRKEGQPYSSKELYSRLLKAFNLTSSRK